MTDDLVRFLRARLDHDEVVVRAADDTLGQRQLNWSVQVVDDAFSKVIAGGRYVVGTGEFTPQDAEHIARHDPARVLREVEAHRTTVDEYDIALGAPAATDQAAYWKGHTETLREICLRLAAVHADHPDYDPSWSE